MNDSQADSALATGSRWGLVQPSSGAAGPEATVACTEGDRRHRECCEVPLVQSARAVGLSEPFSGGPSEPDAEIDAASPREAVGMPARNEPPPHRGPSQRKNIYKN